MTKIAFEKGYMINMYHDNNDNDHIITYVPITPHLIQKIDDVLRQNTRITTCSINPPFTNDTPIVDNLGDMNKFSSIGQLLEHNLIHLTLKNLRRQTYNAPITPILGFLASSLFTNTILRSLNLDNNWLVDADLFLMRDVLLRNTTLTSLSLNKNMFTDQAINHFSTQILKNTSLKELNIGGSILAKYSKKELLRELYHQKSIISINLGLIPVSAIGLIIHLIKLKKYTRLCFQCDEDSHERSNLTTVLEKDITLLDTHISLYTQISLYQNIPDEHIFRSLSIRNRAIQWKYVKNNIIDIVMSLYNIFTVYLPPYVLLEIIDWLPLPYRYTKKYDREDIETYDIDVNVPLLHLINQMKKVNLIESLYRSIKSIKIQY